MFFFPSKKHLAFLTIERYDIELTNINILGKNIVPPGGAQGPEGGSLFRYFELLLILARNAEFPKTFQVQILLFMVTSMIL